MPPGASAESAQGVPISLDDALARVPDSAAQSLIAISKENDIEAIGQCNNHPLLRATFGENSDGHWEKLILATIWKFSLQQPILSMVHEGREKLLRSAGRRCLEGAATLSVDLSSISTHLGVYCDFEDSFLDTKGSESGISLLTSQLDFGGLVCTLFHPATAVRRNEGPLVVGKLFFKAGLTLNTRGRSRDDIVVILLDRPYFWLGIYAPEWIEAVEVCRSDDGLSWQMNGKEAWAGDGKE